MRSHSIQEGQEKWKSKGRDRLEANNTSVLSVYDNRQMEKKKLIWSIDKMPR